MPDDDGKPLHRSLHCYGKKWDVVTLGKKRDPSMCQSLYYSYMFIPSNIKEVIWLPSLDVKINVTFGFIMWRFVTESLNKMKGKIPEIASSHVSSRVLQVKFLPPLITNPISHPPLSLICSVSMVFVITASFIDFLSPTRLALNTVHKMKGMLSLWNFSHISLA